jgi:hypothetical protein
LRLGVQALSPKGAKPQLIFILIAVFITVVVGSGRLVRD